MTTSPDKKKTRILQVLYSLEYGGSERLASFLSYSIDRTKFETAVLGLYGGGPISQELTRHGIPHYHFQYDKKPGGTILQQIRLYRFIQRMRIDIIQVHGTYPFTRILIPAKLSKTKIFSTIHSTHSLKAVPRLRLMFKGGALFCDSIVTVSHALRQYLVKELGIRSDKVRVIHNGVDLSKFNPAIGVASVPGIPRRYPSQTFVGVIGRLREEKDHAGLFIAWEKVSKAVPDMILFLIGDGYLRQELERFVSRLGIGESVIFLGERDDLPQIINQMDLIVLPSKSESFPISILEAMAMKKPVIATRVGGIPEMIVDGENGILVTAQSPAALAESIIHFTRNREMFNYMATKGYETVKNEFSDWVLINNYQNLYQQLL